VLASIVGLFCLCGRSLLTLPSRDHQVQGPESDKNNLEKSEERRESGEFIIRGGLGRRGNKSSTGEGHETPRSSLLDRFIIVLEMLTGMDFDGDGTSERVRIWNVCVCVCVCTYVCVCLCVCVCVCVCNRCFFLSLIPKRQKCI